MNIPFGPWRPDSVKLGAPFTVDAVNVYPAPNGFMPVPSAVPVTSAVGTTRILDRAGDTIVDRSGAEVSSDRESTTASVVGAATVRNKEGVSKTFIGTTTKLYRMDTASTFADASRSAGGAYSVAAGDRWQFVQFGALALASNGTDPPQKFDIEATSGAFLFEALGGSPPVAKYIAVIADRIVLGYLTVGSDVYGNQIHWSGLANAEQWTVGTDGSDTQPFYTGGPVTGIVGGEIGYVFQRTKIRRMTPTPGSDVIFQIDETETERGCIAPYSIVEVGADVYFLGGDGFYKLSKGAGQATTIDETKVRQWWLADVRPGEDVNVIGTADQTRRVIMWAYISRNNSTAIPDRVMIYNWGTQEWSRANMTVTSWVNAIGTSYTLDSLDSVSDLDSLPYSLDSTYWTGSTGAVGVIGSDLRLSVLAGEPMAATIETMDAKLPGTRTTYVSGVIPEVDTVDATVSLGIAERHGDSVVWDLASGVEDNGICPQHIESRYIRAKLEMPSGSSWSLAQGLDIVTGDAGAR